MIGNVLQPNFYTTGLDGVAEKGVLTGTIAKTGTFTSGSESGVINGTSSLFKRELQVGDYLYSTTLNEVRKIISIRDELNMGIDRPFSTDLTGENVVIARRSWPRSIVVKDSGSGGVSYVYGYTGSIPFSDGYAQSFNKSESCIIAMTYDATDADAQITVTISY